MGSVIAIRRGVVFMANETLHVWSHGMLRFGPYPRMEGIPSRAGLTSPEGFGGFDMSRSKSRQDLGRASERRERFTALG
jgi:hypothetical protein